MRTVCGYLYLAPVWPSLHVDVCLASTWRAARLDPRWCSGHLHQSMRTSRTVEAAVLALLRMRGDAGAWGSGFALQ